MEPDTPTQRLTRGQVAVVLLKFCLYPSSVMLILLNLIPLFGVTYFGWDMAVLITAYWLESLVIGFFTVCKMAKVGGPEKHGNIAFFIVHYGMFMGGHLLFLNQLFGPSGPAAVSFKDLRWAFAGLFLSHAFSYFYNFIFKGEYLRAPQKALEMKMTSNGKPSHDPSGVYLFSPYSRIFIMHLTVMIGGALVEATKAPLVGVATLVVFKTLADLLGHFIEHHETAGLPKIYIAKPRRRKKLSALKMPASAPLYRRRKPSSP